MANRYAVGIGAGKTWTSSDTSLWSTTSGGSSGASVPGSGDVAIFDAASGGSGAYAVSLNYSPTCDINFAGISGAVPLLIRSSVRGTQRTITAANVTVSNFVHFQDIVGAGAGSWDLSAVQSGDCGGNSGITFSPAQTNYWIGGAGNTNAVAEWASSSGGGAGTGRVPLPQDAARVDANSGTGTITQNMTRTGSWDFTGSNGITWTPSTAASFFGSINLTDLATLTGSSQTYTYEGRGTSTLTSAGKTWAKAVTIDAPGGTLSQGDAFITTSTLTLTSGTFNSAGFNTTAFNVVGTGSATRVLSLGASLWTITRGNGNIWNVTSTGLTLNAGTSTLKFTGVLDAARTFDAAGLTYYNLWNNTTGAFAFQFTGSNTFNQVRHDSGRTWNLTAGTTTSFADLIADGVTIGSITAASHTLTKIGGGLVVVDSAVISRSTATPGSTFFATNSTDNGNNSGWTFGSPTITTDATAASASWVAPAATAQTRYTAAAVAAFGSWVAPSASAQTRYTLAATAASASWVAPSATAQLNRRRTIAIAGSRTSYHLSGSRASYHIEGS